MIRSDSPHSDEVGAGDPVETFIESGLPFGHKTASGGRPLTRATIASGRRCCIGRRCGQGLCGLALRIMNAALTSASGVIARSPGSDALREKAGGAARLIFLSAAAHSRPSLPQHSTEQWPTRSGTLEFECVEQVPSPEHQFLHRLIRMLLQPPEPKPGSNST